MAGRMLDVTRNNAAFVGLLPRVVPALAIVDRAGRPILTRAGAFILKRS